LNVLKMRFGVLQYALHLFLASYFVACDVFADVKRYRTRDDDNLERLQNLASEGVGSDHYGVRYDMYAIKNSLA
jgi:hypothetical protein